MKKILHLFIPYRTLIRLINGECQRIDITSTVCNKCQIVNDYWNGLMSGVCKANRDISNDLFFKYHRKAEELEKYHKKQCKCKYYGAGDVKIYSTYLNLCIINDYK